MKNKNVIGDIVSDIGVMTDTLTVVIYKDNLERNNIRNINVSKACIDWLEENTIQIPQELCIFFDLCENQKEPFIVNLLKSMIIQDGFQIENFWGVYFNAEFILDTMMSFYISVDHNICTVEEKRLWIMESEYQINIKLHLLSIMIDSEYYAGILKSFLSCVYKLIRQYHEDKKDELSERYRILFEENKKIFEKSNKQTISVFSMFIEETGVNEYCTSRYNLCIFGMGWKNRADIHKEEASINLYMLGRALSEENRVKLLHYLLVQDEITIAKTAAYLNVSTTAAKYHLKIMNESGMLNCRIENRLRFYSLNRDFLRRAGMVLMELQK